MAEIANAYQCDGCKEMICVARYRCKECTDMDFCRFCHGTADCGHSYTRFRVEPGSVDEFNERLEDTNTRVTYKERGGAEIDKRVFGVGCKCRGFCHGAAIGIDQSACALHRKVGTG